MTSPSSRTIASISPSELDVALGSEGFFIDYGACVVRVRSATPPFSSLLRSVYGAFPLHAAADFADFHVELVPGKGVRRWLRPTARFRIDGVEPFEPFPVTSTLPLFEWGVNWCFGQRFNQHVLLHAGTLALGDRAVVMPAVPGSGKSTLAAAMMLSGFRLLSDEFGVLKPETGELLATLKPVALKNRSIEVIRGFSNEAVLGPVFPETRKGDVAHLAPNATSVAAIHQAARPALVIFPRYVEGSDLEVTPQPPEQTFARLAFNSFNYALLGPVSFDAVANVAESCSGYALRYSRLDEAIDCIRSLLEDTRGGR